MSIDMYLGDSDRQNQSVSSVVKSRDNHYNDLKRTLAQFHMSSPFLSGVTYDSAKKYSQKILIPLIKAGMLLDEAVKESCESFTKKYREEVDTVDLRESELLDKIDRAETLANQSRNLMSLEFRNEHPNATYLRNLQRIEDNHLETKRLLEEKLAKLRSFNSNSRTVFAKVDEIYQLIQKGINEATHSWSEVGRSYLLNEKAIETWMESINQHWINSSYYMAQMAEIVKKGKNMSKDEFERLKNYLEGHPEVAFYNEGIHLIQQYQIVKLGVDKANNFFLNMAEDGINNLLSNLEVTIPQGMKYFKFAINNHTFKNVGIYFNSSQYTLDAGKSILKSIGRGLVHEVDISFATVAKSLGYYVGDNVGRVFTFSISWLKSVFIGIDVYLNSLEEKIGTAVVHSLTSAYLINVGINIVDTILSVFPFTNPFLAHPILTPIVVGFGIGSFVDKAYRENLFGVKDTINNIGEYITNSMDNVGQTISSTLNNLKFSFGW